MKQNTAVDEFGALAWSELSNLTPDLSHYQLKPDSIYLSLAGGERTPDQIVEEIIHLRSQYNAQSFAFLDHAIADEKPELLRSLLEAIITKNLKVRFSALGDLPVRSLVNHPDLAYLMKRAGYAQIFFADDRDNLLTLSAEQALIDDASHVADICRTAGFQLRTDAVTVSLCIGRPGESLEQRATTATHLAHQLGSIIFWPYQPLPAELPDVALEDQNGKLFPMRSYNGVQFSDYHGILGLASVLNAKYRTETFDFLGDRMIARLFRESIERQAWNPPEEIKGTLKLPALKR